MSEDYGISELEQLVTEEQPEKPPSRLHLNISRIAFSVGLIIIDLITGYAVWQISYWYYGVIWFLANAISFYLHQQNWESPRANDFQEANAKWGMGVSVASMFIGALAAGVVMVAQIRTLWVEAVFVSVVVALFFWHCYQLAMYYFSDDEWNNNRVVTRAKAIAIKRRDIAKAGGDVVMALKGVREEKEKQARRVGDAGAYQAQLAKMEGRQPAPSPAMRAAPMSLDAPQVNMSDNGHRNPTEPPRNS